MPRKDIDGLDVDLNLGPSKDLLVMLYKLSHQGTYNVLCDYIEAKAITYLAQGSNNTMLHTISFR